LLQAKYENNFLSTSFYNFGYLLWLAHVSKSGEFFLNFGPILGIENLKKHEVFRIFNFTIWLLYIASQKKRLFPMGIVCGQE
jgi:hypothetical protein